MSDSVGRISLEIDLSGSLDRQINTMATNIGSQISGTIERHVRGSMNGVNRMLSSVRMPAMPSRRVQTPQVRAPEVDVEATRAQIASLGATLDNVNGKLDFQRRKLEELKVSFASTYNETRRNRLEGQILNTEAAILRLTQTSDRTASQIWELEDSLSDTAETATEVSVATDQLNNSLDRSNRSLNRSNNSLNRTGESTRRTGHAFAFMGRQSNIMGNSVSRALTRILKQVFVFAVLYQAIRGYTSHVGSALRTNEAFMHSLNQVRTNLQVAFMPVYQAILPALNALMSALATVTAYIASFLSVLFGKTYKQSFKAAQGLNAAKTAMQGFGSASKKAAKDAKNATLGLAGFDEINSLAFTDHDAESGADAGGAVGGIAPLVTPDMDTSIIDGKMATLIGSIQTVLQPSIDALKRLWIAMDPFKSFVAQGAIDFFKNFLTPVGSWVMGEGIPRFLDALALGFQAVNWPTINDGLNGLWMALTPFALIVGEGLLWFWEKVLVPLGAWTISNVVPVFLKILSGAIGTVSNTIRALFPLADWLFETFLKPLAKWTGGIIVSVLGKIGDALTVIGDWIKNHQKWVESIAIVILSFAAAWKIVTVAMTVWSAAVAIWNGIAVIAAAVTTALGTAVAFLTSPIGIAVVAIGALIAIGVLLYKNWDVIKEKAKVLWAAVTASFSVFSKWLDRVFATDWSKSFGAIGHIMNALIANAKNVVDGLKKVFKGITDFIAGAFSGDWKRAWEGVKNIFKGVADTLGAVMKAPLNAIIGMINSAIAGLNKMKVPDWVPGIGGLGVNLPKIPMLARGGIVDQPTLAMVGEAGKEAVMPLENNTGWINNLAGQIAGQMGGSGGELQSQGIIEVLFMILAAIEKMNKEGPPPEWKLDGTTFARLFGPYIQAEAQRMGSSIIKPI